MRCRGITYPLVAALMASCAPSPAPPTTMPARSVETVTINNIPRTYIVRVPPAYDGKQKIPMVILLHGAGDSAAYAEEAYHFVEKSQEKTFLLVLPNALGEFHAWRAFDPDTPDATNNDLAFLDAILATTPKSYAVDTDRIYVCGHSSGAEMAYRLAAERSDVIAAAGIVAGTVGDARAEPPVTLPKPHGPVPLILFHGKKDPILPYDGGGIFSVKQSIAFWSDINKCPHTPSRTEQATPRVTKETYDSPIGAEIVLYSLDDGNHMWPGGKIMPGKDQEPVQDISATDLMWDFFAAHSRSSRAK